MFIDDTTMPNDNKTLLKLIREKDRRIEALIRENERLRIEINTLRNESKPVA